MRRQAFVGFWQPAWTALAVIGISWGAGSLAAQQVDVFLLKGSPIRGDFQSSAPDKLVVSTRDGKVEIDPATIRVLAIENTPKEMETARKRFDDARYDDGLAELEKISTPPRERLLAQELAYLRAFGAAQSSFSGGSVTPTAAGKAVQEFTSAFPESFRILPMIEILGRLYAQVGRGDLAQKEFQRLADSPVRPFQVRGHFQLGKVLLEQNQGPAAAASFQKVLEWNENSDQVQNLKKLAEPLNAKALALGGKFDEARQIVRQLTERENSENLELFGLCYNVLGYCDLQQQDLEGAAMNFLHTHLLFNTGEPHAEALYHLAQIWPQLNKNEYAFEARENLRRLYPNSPWNAKLK